MTGFEDMIFKSLQRSKAASREDKPSGKLTFKRDEKGVLWSYDAAGNKVGRIYEHGDDQPAKKSHIDHIDEI